MVLLDNPKKKINERVRTSLYDLAQLELDGCITGSCVLQNDFSEWETEPDIDFFSYSKESWIIATITLSSQPRYVPATKKDSWKLERIKQSKFFGSKTMTQTIYIKDTKTDTFINLSYKPGTSNILDVLSRFDTIAVMVGLCCRTRQTVDLRHAFFPYLYPLPVEFVGEANPIRLWYMAEGWDETTWERELARIKKYDLRGFNMNDLAMGLLGVARRVLEKGEAVGSEKSRARYLNLMLSCYRPTVWLEEFLWGKNEQNEDTIFLSENIFKEIIELTKDLPSDVRENILADLSIPLDPSGDKAFEKGEEDLLDEEKAEDR